VIGSVKANDYGASSFLASGNAVMQRDPTFAFVTIGTGCYLGFTVRDLILANSLHRRGFKVVIYWMMECNSALVDKGIRQRILCRGIRYHFKPPSDFLDKVVGPLLFLFPGNVRVRVIQNASGYVDRLLENLIRSLFAPPEPDRSLVRRLLKNVAADEVTHLIMSFASICPLALQAKRNSTRSIDYVVSFQGDEEFASHARKAGLWEEYRQGLKEIMDASGSRGIVVSYDYGDRISEEMGIDARSLEVIYNGVECPKALTKSPIEIILQSVFPDLDQDRPVVSYIGRQESENGIDLLLCAAKILEARSCAVQLVVCGSTSKVKAYQKVIGDIAGHLRIPIYHAGTISVDVRNALRGRHPGCRHSRTSCQSWRSSRRRRCGRQTSVTARTLMHGSKLALTIWFWAAYLMATHSNGISALQLLKQLGLGSYKTAWLLSAKLRRAMVAPDRNPLVGVVEVDETTSPIRPAKTPSPAAWPQRRWQDADRRRRRGRGQQARPGAPRRHRRLFRQEPACLRQRQPGTLLVNGLPASSRLGVSALRAAKTVRPARRDQIRGARLLVSKPALELDERAGKIGHGGRSDDDVRYPFYADQPRMSPQFVAGPCGISLCVRIQSVRSGVKDAYVTSAFVRIVPAILRAGQRDRSVPTINGVGASG
jgi:glycosyltransferase involved in cell wall biosynthesis